jgi:hypothetical protein
LLNVDANGVSRDNVQIKVDGIAPRQQEDRGRENRLAGEKKKNVSQSSQVSHMGGYGELIVCRKEQKWNEGRQDGV